ncbi:hypothetical protein [Flavobacterium sp. 102]|uniref:hypothetical protein n=1 Tax=Flavobacterium sp. 102 TaxID=2135623 RepID=UPI000EADD89F|nr:hypothetical protein [Flavobacterium sp. 102]RKS00448.1 hypothetical protein C8C84_0058 [Flavobacterium sp. 102]
MNHIEQREELKVQLKQLKDFMPLCPDYSLPKLMRETHIVLNRINHINEMGVDQLLKEVPIFLETKQSKSNFKTV